MRGIAGLVHFDQRPIDPARLGRLRAALTLGSIDRATQAVSADGAAGLAHVQRDLAPEDRWEAQPLRGADGDVFFVTEARLENRADLAAALGWSPAEAAARPDGALVLAAYERWGEACPARLEGKWALAAWHARERRFFAAVDAFGFRPFYYFRSGATLAFASTLRALLALPEVPRDLHDGVLADFLLFTRSHPGATLYRELRALPGGHTLRADAAGLALTRYWRADHRSELRLGSDAEYQAAFNAELAHAVNASLRVEGNIGIMVSGGLDSAAVTAVAGKLLAARGQRLQALHQLPPPGDPRRAWLREHDESPHVRKMQAAMPHVDFHFLPPAPEGERRVSLARLEALLDEQCGPMQGIVCEPRVGEAGPAARLNLRLLLFGLGGNYAVSLEEYGSDYFAQLAVQLRWVRLWRELAGHAKFYGPTIRHLVKFRILLPLLGRTNGDPDDRGALAECLQPDFVRRAAVEAKLHPPRSLPWRAEDFSVKRRVAWILNELMPQNVGVCGSVLGRGYTCDGHSPLMAHRLNAFCLSLPVEQQIRDGRDRLLLRRAMRGLLPDDVAWRTTRGLPTPASWQALRALLAVLPEALGELEKSPLAASYVDLAELRRRFVGADEAALRRAGGTRLLQLFNLAWFLRWHERGGVRQL
ncbi:MAG: putative asparagine synthetase [Verrucomicrobiota bacterium]